MSGTRDVDLEAAINDPAAVFGTPEAVAEHPALTPAEKVEILRRWSYDAAEVSVAGEEGMPAADGRADDDLLQRIVRCLHRVGDGFDAEHPAPTKQHGLPRGDQGEDEY